MTEKFRNALLECIKDILLAIVGFVSALFVTSCGTTRAVITNRAENTTTEVKITTNNPTTVNVNPETRVDFTPIN